LDEIFAQAADCPVPLTVGRQDFDFVAQKPKEHRIIEEIRGHQDIRVDVNKHHIVWLDESASLTCVLRPRWRVDDANLRTYWGTGRRRDLDRHEPVYQVREARIPAHGLGFALRYPFNCWNIQSNTSNRVIGHLLEYQIDYL